MTHKVARNRYVQLARITGSGARSTTSSVRRRVVEFWVVAHATDGSLQQRLLGVACGLACGRERSQKVLWVPRKGAMWCVYFCGLCLEWYGLPAKPSTRFARGSALLVPEGAKIGAPSGTLPWEPQHLLTQLAASESAPDESATPRA